MSADLGDAALTAGLVAAFAALVTVHVAVLFGLARRRHYWGAAAGLVLPPFAPVWAWRKGMHARAVAWAVALGLYCGCFALAR